MNMADKRFTWMHSGQQGAPQMTGAKNSEGQLLQVLDACLIDGFNPQTAISLSKTATSVTLVYGVAHGYELSQDVMVTGASDSNLNGRHRVIAKTDTSLTIRAAGITSVTGTIVTKVAPLDFESIFGVTDPLKRAYRSKNIQSTQTVLYLDMGLPASHGYNSANPAKRAMVDLCENMTELGVQINSYTNTFNRRPENRNGQMFWYQARAYAKSTAVSDTDNNDWVVVGNGDFFYLFNDWQRYTLATAKNRDWCAFGDVPSFYDGDNFNCFWAGSVNKNDATPIYWSFNKATLGGDPDIYSYGSEPAAVGFFIKPSTGMGDLQSVSLSIDGIESHTLASGAEPSALAATNTINDTLIGLPIYLYSSNKSLRGAAPNLKALPHDLLDNLSLDLAIADGNLLVAVSKDGFTDHKYGFFALSLGG